MSLDLRVVLPHDRPLLRAVLADPAMRTAYEMYAGDDGVEQVFATDHVPPDAVHVALWDGEPVGFALALLLPAEPPWAMLRGFVRPHARGRGVGRALLTHMTDYLASQSHRPGLVELGMGVWEPNDAAHALASRDGYGLTRTYWSMQRPAAPIAPPHWPAGVHVRTLAEGAPVAHWNDAFNASFADHYRFVPSTVADCERLLTHHVVRPEHVLLAYEGDRLVGFCRAGRHGDHGEIETLGVSPEARRRGLGRALLHWGVERFAHDTPGGVTLMVEGENERALRLYRETAFTVVRTRTLWLRPWARA